MAVNFGRRKKGPGLGVIAGAAGGGLVVLIAVLFWFASQADSKAPPQRDIRVEATNVGGR